MLDTFTGSNFEYQKIPVEEQKARGILGRLVGKIADTTKPTRNNRLYSRKLWEKVFSDPIMIEKIKNRVCFSELEHPTDGRSEIDANRIVACLAEVPKVGQDGFLYGVFDILDTPLGRVLKTLLDYGSTFAISSRGDGDVFTNRNGQEEVDPDTYQCFYWDLVSIPGVEEARLHPVTESLSNKKSLTEALNKLISADNGKDEALIREALNLLGIKLTEATEEVNYEALKREAKEVLDGKYDNPENLSALKDAFNKAVEAQDSDSVQKISALLIKYSPEHKNDEKLQKLAQNGMKTDFVEEPMNIEMTEPGADAALSGMDDFENGAGTNPAGEDTFDNLPPANEQGTPQGEGSDSSLKLSELPPVEESIDNKVVQNNMNDIKQQNAEDINRGTPANEGGNSMTGMLGVLQETLRLKQNAEAEIVKLNAKLSVCYAKEAGQESSIAALTESLKKAEDKIEALSVYQSKSRTQASQLTEANNSIKSLNTKCKDIVEKYNALVEKYNKGVGTTKSLNENLQTSSNQVKQLNETVKTLKEDLSSAETKIESLTESFDKKLKESQALQEKYKRVANTAVSKYISLQALKLDISPNEIRNKLPENYSFNDIDSICESLQRQKVSINMLPFKTHNKVYENMNVQVKGYSTKKESILPNTNYADDTVDDSLKSLAGM